MQDQDLINQLQMTRRMSTFGFWGVVIIITGTILSALYKKKKGNDYKHVVFIGIGMTVLYLVIMSFLALSSVEPLYRLAE